MKRILILGGAAPRQEVEGPAAGCAADKVIRNLAPQALVQAGEHLMTIAYWCVLLAAGMPYLWILYAKATRKFLKDDYNKNPREYEEGLAGPRKRAYWAQLNAFEAFPPFAAGVIIAHLAGVAQSTIDLIALAFLGLRFLHGVFYVANLDKLRSLVWFGGLGCVISLFLAAA